jgi:hypothetical protein
MLISFWPFLIFFFLGLKNQSLNIQIGWSRKGLPILIELILCMRLQLLFLRQELIVLLSEMFGISRSVPLH